MTVADTRKRDSFELLSKQYSSARLAAVAEDLRV